MIPDCRPDLFKNVTCDAVDCRSECNDCRSGVEKRNFLKLIEVEIPSAIAGATLEQLIDDTVLHCILECFFRFNLIISPDLAPGNDVKKLTSVFLPVIVRDLSGSSDQHGFKRKRIAQLKHACQTLLYLRNSGILRCPELHFPRIRAFSCLGYIKDITQSRILPRVID